MRVQLVVVASGGGCGLDGGCSERFWRDGVCALGVGGGGVRGCTNYKLVTVVLKSNIVNPIL
jgi:hypothetical protein